MFIPWREVGEAETLGAAHVGIMPMPDDPFSRGKCALKGLQYMAVGLPVILSPVGVNAEVVDHGKNGLLASSSEEWVNALESLANSSELRTRLGTAGRLTIEQRYTAESSARGFAEAVKSGLRKRRLMPIDVSPMLESVENRARSFRWGKRSNVVGG
jgi:glycosyltransferase involved in cell wall biosynthesis